MIPVKKTFSTHDQSKINKFKAAVLREKGYILGTAVTTRYSPDGESKDSEVTIYAEIPHVCAEIDINSFVDELDNS